MFGKIFITSFTCLSLTLLIYPIKKEKVKPFNYCFSLEKILLRNSLQKRINFSKKVYSITRDLSIVGINQTKGDLINKIIDQYKKPKNKFLRFISNDIYCLGGYWVEISMPGKFESIVYKKSIQKINELKEKKDQLNNVLYDFSNEYKKIKGKFNLFMDNN